MIKIHPVLKFVHDGRIFNNKVGRVGVTFKQYSLLWQNKDPTFSPQQKCNPISRYISDALKAYHITNLWDTHNYDYNKT